MEGGRGEEGESAGRESGRAAGCFMYDCGRELSGSSGRDEAPPWQWLSRAPPWKVSTANQPPSPTHRATNSRTTSPAPHRTRNPPPPAMALASRCCARLARSAAAAPSLRLVASGRRWNSSAAADPKLAGIVDQISGLTLLETSDLVSLLKVCCDPLHSTTPRTD